MVYHEFTVTEEMVGHKLGEFSMYVASHAAGPALMHLEHGSRSSLVEGRDEILDLGYTALNLYPYIRFHT
jgi:hypothetical protein